MYGYDLYDALQTCERAFLCCCMIVDKDSFPLGQVLYKTARTRCTKARYDGFIYDIRDKKLVCCDHNECNFV
jgi:hypothetical protein